MSGTTTTTYTYDAIGKRTAIQSDWVANELTTWDFDADGRVVRVFDPIKRAIETQYDRRGLKTTITYDSGRTQSNAYDSDSRNTGIRNVIAGNDVQRFTYTFDANGNRIGTVDLNGSVTTYTLDANDRLTEDLTVGTDAHTFTYTYDSRGNLLTTSETGVVVAHAYDAASRLVTSTAGGVVTTYTFDVNGNMVSANAGGTVTSNTYDRENRLTATDTIGVSDGVFSFGGDFHRKREREVELYYLDDLIIGEGQGGALTKLYLQLGGQLVGEVLDIGDSAQPRYYLADFLGSVTGQTNPGNDLEFERRMTPFGNLLSGQPFIDNGANWVGAHGYRYGNHPFAQVYVWHRVYALQTSQWTTRDLLWPEERAYGYVDGDPINWLDDGGLRKIQPTNPNSRPGSIARLPVVLSPSTLRPGIAVPSVPARPPIWQRPPTVPTIDPAYPSIIQQTPCSIPALADWLEYAGIPLPKPGEWPAHDPVLSDGKSPVDPCKELRNTKNRWCPGNNKQGWVRKCRDIPGKVWDKQSCDFLAQTIRAWQRCYQARWDELRWRCLPPKQVAGHKVQAEAAEAARRSCQRLYRNHCDGKFPPYH